MKIISPQEAISEIPYRVSVDNNNAKELLEFICGKISYRTFHHNSKLLILGETKKYFIINITRYNWMGYAVFDRVVQEMQNIGWDCNYIDLYCGHGPFTGFRIRTNDFCPETHEHFVKFEN